MYSIPQGTTFVSKIFVSVKISSLVPKVGLLPCLPGQDFFFFFLLTSYSTEPRVISSCNVKLELEKRKVVFGAEAIKGVEYLFGVVTAVSYTHLTLPTIYSV